MEYGYYINLDERGEFYADVRDQNGNTIFEVRNDEEDGSIGLVEAGYMRDPHDLSGLADYLATVSKVIPPGATIHPSDEFEARLDEAHTNRPGM